MNIQSFIGKFRSGGQSSDRLVVVVQPGALFFSSVENIELPTVAQYEGFAWQEALIKVLSESKLSGTKLDVVLNSQLYQTYQIEKPAIPDAELAEALPFLLKDLITEKVTEIVADAVELPTNNKLQVYVTKRALILSLYEQTKALDIELDRVLVEDEVWGHSAGERSHFILLQRSKQGPFRISAYAEYQNAFQRTIRGVTPPLTGVASSILQLDGMALELQRSIDYLSSQMRGVALSQMLVCCDEEEQDEIVQALRERLSVKVAPLSESGDETGVILTQTAESLTAVDVNLFPDSLKPKKEHFTLANVVAVWLLVGGALGAIYGYLMFNQIQLDQQVAQLKRTESQLSQQLNELNLELEKHKPSANKIAAIARLKTEIDDKQKSLKAVGEFDQTQQVGYSATLRSLAELGRNDISLQSIFINAEILDMQGLAREAKSIPNWVNQFKSELNLVGRSFEKLSIGRNEDEIITFELKTKRGTE